MLLGVGGSGKQSLARLAGFMAGLEIATLTTAETYGATEFLADIAAQYIRYYLLLFIIIYYYLLLFFIIYYYKFIFLLLFHTYALKLLLSFTYISVYYVIVLIFFIILFPIS
jgi:hypothetical protein